MEGGGWTVLVENGTINLTYWLQVLHINFPILKYIIYVCNVLYSVEWYSVILIIYYNNKAPLFLLKKKEKCF